MLAVVLIFLVLAAQFNSFRDPFIILLGSVPLAMFGALIFCFLKMPGQEHARSWTNGWTTTLNIYSQVGLVTLVGLVSKNGILIVEFANELQRPGRTKMQAVREAALTRLRPVLMTSVATVAGHFPADAGHRRRRGGAQFHRHRARRGHGPRHAVHAAGDSLHLRFDRQWREKKTKTGESQKTLSVKINTPAFPRPPPKNKDTKFFFFLGFVCLFGRLRSRVFVCFFLGLPFPAFSRESTPDVSFALRIFFIAPWFFRGVFPLYFFDKPIVRTKNFFF